MDRILILSAETPGFAATGSPTVKDGKKVQRFVKKVLPVGTYTKRDLQTNRVIWELKATPERIKGLVDTFKSMRDAGVPVRLKDETGQFSIDLPKEKGGALTKNHAGAYEKNQTKGVQTMVENIVADTIDMFVDENGTLCTVHDVEGDAAIDFVRRAKFTSPEIFPCYIDGTDKKHGEVIRAVSLVANPLIPGQTPFEPIAASDDSPVYICSLENGDLPMIPAALAALIAAMAGVDSSAVNENSAVTILQGVQTKHLKTSQDLAKIMSDEEPNLGVLSIAGKLAMKELDALKGIVSDAGIAKLRDRFVGTWDASKKYTPSPFIMSYEEEPEKGAEEVAAIVKIITDNLAIKGGPPRTTIQGDPHVMDDGKPNETGEQKAARIRGLLSQTVTGREVIRTAEQVR